jgi:hypothetical protein
LRSRGRRPAAGDDLCGGVPFESINFAGLLMIGYVPWFSLRLLGK